MAPSTTDSTFRLDRGYLNTINGELRDTNNKTHGINPATGETLDDVPVAGQNDVDEAMGAAQAAFPSWAARSWSERRAAVFAFAEAIETYAHGFAGLLTQEQGKPLEHALGEVMASATWMRRLAEMELEDKLVEDDGEKKIIVRYTPLGVAVGITPWNFPVIQVLLKITPAVVTGNTIVIKPSPFTPYCALKIGELAQHFFPPGVVQVLGGGDDLGPMLTNHPTPSKIAFTGSTATGKKVAEAASLTLKRVTLELGGNDPAVILPDVNLDKVIPKIATCAFFNSGQVCMAVKRVYVHEAIFEAFRDALVAHVKTLKMGNGTSEGTFFGPLQNSMQFGKAKTLLQKIHSSGAKVSLGGSAVDGPGNFIHPTIVDRPDESSAIVVEEPFAPIVPLLSWSDEADVIKRANDTIWGLGASVWSENLDDADRIARQLEAGMVWVNTHFEQDPLAPSAGHKQSGIGVESSIAGLKGFCNVQALFYRNP